MALIIVTTNLAFGEWPSFFGPAAASIPLVMPCSTEGDTFARPHANALDEGVIRVPELPGPYPWRDEGERKLRSVTK